MSSAADFDDVLRDAGPEAVRRALDAANWTEPSPEYPASVEQPLQFRATPFTWREPMSISRRAFIYGFELCRGQLSATIAPGAAGKTTYKIARAICMVTGRNLLGRNVWNGPHRVWLWNLEDSREEVERTVHAQLKLWGLSQADLGDRLFIDGVDSDSSPLFKVATADRATGHLVRRPVVDGLIDAIKDRGIDHFDVDPFVSSHAVEENDNGAIDAVSKQFVAVAHRTNCAVSLTHHVRKPSGGEPSAHDARGASAMVNAARSVLVFQRMTPENAQDFQVPACDRKRFFSVYDDKNNRAPPAGTADWYEFVSIGLGNGDDSGPEDSVGAIQKWQTPDTFAGVSPRQLLLIQDQIRAQPEQSRAHSTSSGWVGKLIALVLDLDLDEEGVTRRIRRMQAAWVDGGVLRNVTRQAPGSRKMVGYVEAGDAVLLG